MGGGSGGGSTQSTSGYNTPGQTGNTNPNSGPSYYTNPSGFTNPGTLDSYRQRMYGAAPDISKTVLNPNYGKTPPPPQSGGMFPGHSKGNVLNAMFPGIGQPAVNYTDKYIAADPAAQAANQALYDKQVGEARQLKNVMDIGNNFSADNGNAVFTQSVGWDGRPVIQPKIPQMPNINITKKPAQGQGQATKGDKAPTSKIGLK